MARPVQTTTRVDVYQTVTDQIVRQLEQGVRAWNKPWTTSGQTSGVMPLRSTGERYRGINVLLLWGVMQERGYTQPMFMTFKQAQELGGFVRKGEKGCTVVYAGALTKEVENAKGETEEQTIPFMKSYCVFNVEQIEGLPDHCFNARPVIEEPALAAQQFFAKAGVVVRHGGDKAFYTPTQDFVQMPPVAAFADLDAYQSTLAHEATHWTGHASRCNRQFGRRFGDDAYAAEELVAKLGAAFLCADLGVSLEPREDHAQYLASWLRVLKADKRAIFTAASAAQAACDHLHEAAGVVVAQAA